MDDLKKMRDAFRSAADTIDEMLELEERQQNGENVDKEMETAQGKFLMAMLKISSLS